MMSAFAFYCNNVNFLILLQYAEEIKKMNHECPQSSSNLMYCSDCGSQISRRAATCPKCGAPNQLASQAVAPIQNQGYVMIPKSRMVYIILAIFFGLLGIHNFYAGYIGTGILQLILTITGFGIVIVLIWLLFDILLTTKDGRGVPFA
jgi:Predicted membrane protein